MANKKIATLKQDKRKNAVLTKRSKSSPIENIYQSIVEILHSARAFSNNAVNQAMAQSYWHIGRMIVAEEQRGLKRAVIT